MNVKHIDELPLKRKIMIEQ